MKEKKENNYKEVQSILKTLRLRIIYKKIYQNLDNKKLQLKDKDSIVVRNLLKIQFHRIKSNLHMKKMWIIRCTITLINKLNNLRKRRKSSCSKKKVKTMIKEQELVLISWITKRTKIKKMINLKIVAMKMKKLMTDLSQRQEEIKFKIVKLFYKY